MSDLQDQLTALFSSISLGQNAPWYAAGFAFFVALGQRGAGKADARTEFEAELAKARKVADEAAGAAALAAKGAAIAKEAASQMKTVGEDEEMTANTILESSRLRQMVVEAVSV
jgi:hypothetical protein